MSIKKRKYVVAIVLAISMTLAPQAAVSTADAYTPIFMQYMMRVRNERSKSERGHEIEGTENEAKAVAETEGVSTAGTDMEELDAAVKWAVVVFCCVWIVFSVFVGRMGI